MCAFGSAANATVISVNMDRWSNDDPDFFLYDQNVPQLGSAETAGLVVVSNWNAYDPGAQSFQGTTPVYDSGGAVGGGFTVTGTGGSDSWNTGGTNNQKMFGDFAGNGTKTISNIPYANYSLIVYSKLYSEATQSFDIDGGTAQTITNTLNGSTEAPQEFDAAPPNGSNGIFVDGLQYTTFTGLTASSITLNHDSLAGFQIVQVPEPTSMSLLALGGLALLRRRRRS